MSNSVNLAGYHLTFDAEMTSAADLSLFGNTFYNGDTTIAGNSEAETYVPSATNPGNYTFANGALSLNATPTGSGKYNSGLLSTAQSFSQNQGYFEIRAKLAPGTGFWSAFWLIAADYSAEVDIVEQPNTDGAQNYFSSIKTAAGAPGGFNPTGVDMSAGYHTYGFMWTASTVQFTFDGNYIGYAAPTPAAMATMKLFMYANLAVGGYGSWPTQPAAGATSSFSIDYIRAYSNNPAIPQWTGTEVPSSPDTPVVTTPVVTTPVVTTPVVTTPVVITPVVTTPVVTTPVVTTPVVTTPVVTTPVVTTPVVTTPVVTTPVVTTPVVTTPVVTTPVVTTPVVTTPVVISTAAQSTALPASVVVSQPAISVDTVSASVYRFFDSRTGTQFLTSNDGERASVLATRPDLIDEGVGLRAVTPATGTTNATGIYRFFDTVYGTHFYTASASERDSIIASQSKMTYEGVAFSDYTTAQPGTTPVYRFFNSTNGTHLFSDSDSERSTIQATRPDLVFEGVVFYAPSAK